MPLKSMPRIKVVRSKGKRYVYFKTNRTNNGKPVYIKMPDIKDRGFGASYASAMAGLNRTVDPIFTVPILVDLYQKSPKYRSLAANTQKVYDIYLRDFANALPTAPANEIERSDIARLMDERGRRPAAAQLMKRIVSALYSWGRSRGHVTAKPCEDFERHEGGEHEPWPDAILEAALKDEAISLPVALLYFTGQRIGDVCAMRWTDIRDGAIHITQEKTGKPLEVPIHDTLAPLLAAEPRRGFFIVSKASGGPYQPNTLRLKLQAWARTSFGMKVVPHGLRKNAVNALLEHGCSVAEVSAITGQTMQMVEHYARRRNTRKIGQAAMLKWTGSEK